MSNLINKVHNLQMYGDLFPKFLRKLQQIDGDLFPKFMRKSRHIYIIWIQFPFIMGNNTF